ncbi:phosphomannomutase/phosphoglucomutase [Legionella dresdenensis]|uniref:phosphomannomutase n=1 Tax=Legionella dresdenensis TaxID=450200 RepID=A0ABV8CFT8_9GAMM
MSFQIVAVKKEIFRAYDIRGIVGEQIDENCFYTIGKAISYQLSQLNRKQIFLARDGRLSSKSLTAALRQGLLDSGIDVTDIGEAATPVMYYATFEHGIDSGLMVTGSHNPGNYNGIKMILAGKTLVQSDIDKLYHIIQAGTFQQGQGQMNRLDILNDYMNRLVRDIKLERPLKVVIDCGNGIAGPVAPEIFRRLGCQVIPLFCEVDGRFPNHHPDPTVESNLIDLKAAVAEHQADIGLGFDGDADRLGVVTNTGKVIWPDRLMMFYALDILKRNPGATIVYDVKCSSHLAAVIKNAGGQASMCPTGHSIVKAVMKDLNAVLAGEMSGHLFFKDGWYGFDDAMYSACRLLELISKSHQTVEQQFDAIPDSVNTPEIKITIDETRKFHFMQLFSELAQFDEASIIRIDGLRVEFEQGWGLVRASNTTPCLVARFEASDQENLADIQNRFKNQLLKVDNTLDIPF